MPATVQSVLWWGNRHWYQPYLHRRFGDSFTMRIRPVGTVLVMRNPDHVREIFRGDPSIFHAGEGNSLLTPLVGPRSVLTLDVPEHKTERRRMTPPFHGERIAAVVDVMADAAEREVARWPVGQDFPLLQRTQALTLDIIVRVVLGVDESGRAAEVGRALRAVLELKTVDLMMFWLSPRLHGFGRVRRMLDRLEHADRLIYEEIDRRRRDPDRANRPDVLSMLLDGDPPRELVRDEIVTALAAGHETTAVGLAWTFERLLRHPRALARVREGLDEMHDPYRTAVVKEALRVRPVIYNVARRVVEPVEIGEVAVPAGVVVLPSIAGLHLDRRIWGPDAAAFRPERWLEPDAPQHAWIPFGGGTRRCLGAVFAQTEIETVLAEVLRRVELTPARATDERATMHNITVVPRNGAQVRVTSVL